MEAKNVMMLQQEHQRTDSTAREAAETLRSTKKYTERSVVKGGVNS